MPEIIEILIKFLISATVALGLVITILIIAIATALAYSFLLPREYIAAMLAQARNSVPETEESNATLLARIFRMSDRADREVAMANYFFGPAEADAGAIAKAAVEGSSKRWRAGISTAGDINSGEGIGRIIIFFGMRLGMLIGSGLGIVFTAVVATIHMSLLTVSVLTVLTVSYATRYVDTAMRYVRGVVMRCPNARCSRRVRPYPAYRCPGCGELHRDIRPGPYGLVMRTCKCGERLPTLLLIGAGRLTAVCQQCGNDLPAGFGTAPEIFIPVFGSANAGKTRLIFMLAMAFEQMAAEGRISLINDDETERRLAAIRESLEVSKNTAPTLAKSPEPYIFRLKVGLNKRIIYLFDAAGEMHYRLISLDELGYLDKGNTLIYVIDPLATDRFWDGLPAEEKEHMSAARSSREDMEIAYEQTREHMRRMGRPAKEIKFAFALSKADLISKSTDWSSPTKDELRQIVQGPSGMDMGNVVVEASQSFKSVDFFLTAAVKDEDGAVDGSIVELARWILSVEGVVT
jgi:hypothetical protein